MSRTRGPPRTPPSETQLVYIEESSETPGPVRAQINHLQRQVKDLVRNDHNAARKHTAEIAALQSTITKLQIDSKDSVALRKSAEVREAELQRLKQEGEKMREELNLHSIVAQQKALLAVATEQLKMVELEQRLVQAEATRLMRDHKIALFKAREADLEAELAEKDATIEQLEADLDEANTSLAHQRTAQAKASKLQSETSQTELEDAQAQLMTLQSKFGTLENKLRASKDKEKELKAELESALNETKKDGSDKEKREFQRALREAKAATDQKAEEVSDLQEELSSLKEASKQREQALKAKVKEAASERDRLLGVEEELAGMKAAKSRTSSPARTEKTVTKPKAAQSSLPEVTKSKTKITNASPKKRVRPVESDDEEPYIAPAEPKASLVKSKSSTALRETSDNERPALPAKQPKAKLPVPKESARPEPEKKKIRKLVNAKPTFEWDSIMQSGDGVIPAYLSPAKPTGKTVGTIPRAGFKTLPSARGFGKLL